MTKRYEKLVESLDYAEVTLLDEHMRQLRRALRPGVRRLNWNALGVKDYIDKCNNVRLRLPFASHIRSP